MQDLQLALRILIFSRCGLQLLDLRLDQLQLGLCFGHGFHIWVVIACWRSGKPLLPRKSSSPMRTGVRFVQAESSVSLAMAVSR